MKITSTGIEINDFSEFKHFLTDYDLLGAISLSDPILDKSGNVLLKEKVSIRENIIKKLEEMDGKFIPSFKIGISKDLMKMLKGVLSKAILSRIDEKGNDFIKHLYEQNVEKMSSLRGIIQNAFYTKPLAWAFFGILINNKDFFNHLADFGLLSLGSVIQNKIQLKMLNRYSFLAGICADISASKDNIFKRTLSGGALKITASLSVEMARKFGLAEEVISAIGNHPLVNFEIPGATLAQVDAESLKAHPLNQELLAGNDTGGEGLEPDDSEVTPFSENTMTMVLESLKIARFIMENLKISEDKEHVSEQLLVMFAYNATKGAFLKDIADLMTERFQEFDTAIKQIQIIAEIENKCKFPVSAWAYPKPRSAQMLCKDRNYHCPLIVNGWDLKIVTPQEPHGFIGTTLRIGTYPKCALEEELKEKVTFIADTPTKRRKM